MPARDPLPDSISPVSPASGPAGQMAHPDAVAHLERLQPILARIGASVGLDPSALGAALRSGEYRPIVLREHTAATDQADQEHCHTADGPGERSHQSDEQCRWPHRPSMAFWRRANRPRESAPAPAAA